MKETEKEKAERMRELGRQRAKMRDVNLGTRREVDEETQTEGPPVRQRAIPAPNPDYSKLDASLDPRQRLRDLLDDVFGPMKHPPTASASAKGTVKK